MPGGYVGSRPKDESKLSQNPAQIRNRIRRSRRNGADDGRILRDLEMLYKKPVGEWDLEELARGRPRNKNGNFAGARPAWINPTIQLEAKKRLKEHTKGLLAVHLPEAIKTIYNLMTSEEVDEKGKPIVDARTRMQAAQFIVEHLIGKATASVEVSESEDMVRTALVPAIVLDDGTDQSHLVIDGDYQVIEENDEMEELEDVAE